MCKELKDFLAAGKGKGRCGLSAGARWSFTAFLETPFEKVKAVVMGQDPYHGEGQAHGLSFSVPCGITPPPSLKNIFKNCMPIWACRPPATGCLEAWARQGVLLLNATLTVRGGEPKSHYGKGWERFTDAVIAKLSEREDPLVFVLWGKSALEKVERILGHGKKCPTRAPTAPHPSPYSVHTGFFGSRPSPKINGYLEKWGKAPIDGGEVFCGSYIMPLYSVRFYVLFRTDETKPNRSELCSRSQRGAPLPNWQGRRGGSIWRSCSRSKRDKFNRSEYNMNNVELSLKELISASQELTERYRAGKKSFHGSSKKSQPRLSACQPLRLWSAGSSERSRNRLRRCWIWGQARGLP